MDRQEEFVLKHIIATAAITLFYATGSAIAASPVELAEIQGYAPNTDLSTLSDQQVILLLQIIHSKGGEGRKTHLVRGFLLQANGDSILNIIFK